MKNYNASTVTALAAETARVFWFVDILLDSQTYRYSDADLTLYSGGNAYEPNGFEVSEINFTHDLAVDRVSIDFQNVDLVASGSFLNETIVNRTVNIAFGCLDSSNQIIALEDVFNGFITGWGGMSVKRCPIQIANYFLFWHKQSLRLAQAKCPWAFKSTNNTECGYSGSETECNKTWTRCKALGNQLNFGGHRWLPGMRDKKIYWGRWPGQLR